LNFLTLLAVGIELGISEAFEGDSCVHFWVILQKEHIVFAMRFEVVHHHASFDVAGPQASVTFDVDRMRRRWRRAGLLRKRIRRGTKKPDSENCFLIHLRSSWFHEHPSAGKAADTQK
jgi:hypothetical protein